MMCSEYETPKMVALSPPSTHYNRLVDAGSATATFACLNHGISASQCCSNEETFRA